MTGLTIPSTLQTKEIEGRKPEPVIVTKAPIVGPDEGESDNT